MKLALNTYQTCGTQATVVDSLQDAIQQYGDNLDTLSQTIIDIILSNQMCKLSSLSILEVYLNVHQQSDFYHHSVDKLQEHSNTFCDHYVFIICVMFQPYSFLLIPFLGQTPILHCPLAVLTCCFLTSSPVCANLYDICAVLCLSYAHLYWAVPVAA